MDGYLGAHVGSKAFGAPIGDVAGSVGFDDPSHFSQMFRSIGGLSPKEFRGAVQLSGTDPDVVVP